MSRAAGGLLVLGIALGTLAQLAPYALAWVAVLRTLS